MIPYFDKRSAKQFIRGKPIGFGYKMWVLTTPLGNVLQFEAYQGARGRQTEYPGIGMGEGEGGGGGGDQPDFRVPGRDWKLVPPDIW